MNTQAVSQRRIATLVAVLAVLLLGIATVGLWLSPDDARFDRTVSMPDPASTSDLAFLGGSAASLMAVDDLPGVSEAALKVKVLDVHRSIPNTVDGKFPPIDLDGSHNQLTGLYPLTEVEVEVLEVLGGDSDAEVGDIVIITVNGGAIATLFTPEEARLFGIEGGPSGSPSSETVPHPESGEAVEPTEEPRTDPDANVQYTMGIAPSDSFSEGETLAIFVRSEQTPLFDTDATRTVLRVTHPIGIFRLESGLWDSSFDARTTAVDVQGLAHRIGD